MHFANLLKVAESGQVVHISRHSKPVAMLLFVQAYALLQQLNIRQPFGSAIDRWRLAGLSCFDEDWPLASDPSADQEVASWRDLASGRTVDLCSVFCSIPMSFLNPCVSIAIRLCLNSCGGSLISCVLPVW